MLRLLAGEDFRCPEGTRILRGVMRRTSNADIVRVQDVGLDNRPDPEILEWAAADAPSPSARFSGVSRISYAWITPHQESVRSRPEECSHPGVRCPSRLAPRDRQWTALRLNSEVARTRQATKRRACVALGFRGILASRSPQLVRWLGS